jgi:integrase
VVSNVYEYMSQRALRERTGVTENPVAGMDLGANNGTRRDRVALPEEAAELLDALDSLDRVPYALAFYGGPRRGDIRRLDWSDLEYQESRGGHKTPGYWLLIRPLSNRHRGPGKVGDGRWIPLAPQLRAVLLEEWQRQGRPTSGAIVKRSVIAGHLYAHADKVWQAANERKAAALGRPLRPRGKREAWGPEHQLEPIRLQECRHTYCLWLVRSRKWDVDAMMKFMATSSSRPSSATCTRSRSTGRANTRRTRRRVREGAQEA